MSQKCQHFSTHFSLYNKEFLIGLGSVFSVFGNYYDLDYYSSDEERDAKAIANDWCIVGQDLQTAITKSLTEESKFLGVL